MNTGTTMAVGSIWEWEEGSVFVDMTRRHALGLSATRGTERKRCLECTPNISTHYGEKRDFRRWEIGVERDVKRLKCRFESQKDHNG